MNTKMIIPCMDIRNGKVVKGVNFEGIKEIDDPVTLAQYYNESGADELVFYDITASSEGKQPYYDLIKKVVQKISIPLMVGGGISSLQDVDTLMQLGAKRVSINTGAIKSPDLITAVAQKYGSQSVVLSMDVKRVDGKFMVFRSEGRQNTGIEAVSWAIKGEALGAGGLVINSIDTDGVKGGFDIEMLKAIGERVAIPLVASGGAGKAEDFIAMFKAVPQAGAGLAASIFHSKQLDIRLLKQALKDSGIQVAIN